MSSGLGKSYNRSPDQTTKRKSRVKKESISPEGSTGFGRSLPVSGQGESGNHVGSGKNEGGQNRKNQPARPPISSTLREQVFKRDHYKCCNGEASTLTDKKVRFEIDHIVPV